jgi:hypothetical protein
MKTSILLFAAALTVFWSMAQSQFKKYDLQTGKVAYETVMRMGTMKMKTTSIVYFDDYGMKECRETYADGELKDSYLSDGKDLYALKHQKKTAFKQGPASRGTELRAEWTEFGTQKDRDEGKIRKIPSKKIAGKTCEMFESDDGKGTVTQYGGWKKILMYLAVKTKMVESIQTATKIEENVKVPAEKFAVPKGYSIQ